MTDEIGETMSEGEHPYDQWGLFTRHRVIVLPQYINHRHVYETILRATLDRPSDPITLYCSGDGGGAYETMSIVALIKHHGQFIAHLTGMACSAHSVIFAACQTRYVYPMASLGIHECASEQMAHLDQSYARYAVEDMGWIDAYNAAVYRDACHEEYSASFWSAELRKAGSHGMVFVRDFQMIQYGMAKPISDLPKPPSRFEGFKPARDFYKSVEGSDKAV